jgi:hypothetical protein
MWFEPWILVSGSQFLLMILGVITKGHYEEWAKRHKGLVLVFFLCLGVIGLFGTIWQAAKSSREAAESRATLQNLQNSTKEVRRVQELNTELQKKLLASTDTIKNLAQQNIDTLLGGDSFCYVEVGYAGGDLLEAFILGKGKNPVTCGSIRIVDLDLFKGALAMGDIGKAERSFSFPLPTRYTGLSKPLYRIKLTPDTVSKRFNIFIMATNGHFTGLLRLRRRDDGGWSVANRVTATLYDKRSGIVLEEIDRGFPVDVLTSDPDWKATDKLQRLKLRE